MSVERVMPNDCDPSGRRSSRPLWTRSGGAHTLTIAALGGAAFLAGSGFAAGADLPQSKVAPVDYVRVCSTHGVGFFYIPGTDTCIRIGGRASFAYEFAQYRSLSGHDKSNFIAAGRLQADARTATDWGTLRTFVRFDIASRTGQQHGASGTLRAMGPMGFNATGVDTYNRAYKYVEVDKAFIQFAGLTAGRASSFYDFYMTDIELTNFSITSNVPFTNLLAYTVRFGQGVSATLSMEDPTFRRNPLFFGAVGSSGVVQPFVGLNAGAASAGLCTNGTVVGCTFGAMVYTWGPDGWQTGYTYVDVAQRLNAPDVVANLRVDQGWGSAQLSVAAHQLSAGVKFNLPFAAPGDALWLQAAYARGAMSYTGLSAPTGHDSALQGGIGGGVRFNAFKLDGYVDPFSGAIRPSTSWSATAAFLHYWSPQLRSGFVASYGQLRYPSGARTNGPLGNIELGAGGAYSVAFRNFGQLVGLTNLVWSPVKDLDIGVEALYQRINVKGRVWDANRGGAAANRTTRYDDNWLTRLRIDRTF
ncbi:Porin subfamily protein [Ostertagia ostertagi]